MVSLVPGNGRPPLLALAMGMGICIFFVASGMADVGGAEDSRTCSMGHEACTGHHKIASNSAGTLGYGPPGLYPGFQGFGLGYHLGYGYGGDALGPGDDGGYPFYGGPGYPHPWPTLRRFGPITPFLYFGGPGYPSPTCPSYFGSVGPLVTEQPYVTYEPEPGGPVYAGGYGCDDGTLSYPEMAFAPFVTLAATGGLSHGENSGPAPNAGSNHTPAPGETLDESSPVRALGIEAEPVVDAGRARGLRVTLVYPNSVAEKAGIHAGDVILSINGYLTEGLGHLKWIIANAAPDKLLTMSVLTISDGVVHTVTGRVP